MNEQALIILVFAYITSVNLAILFALAHIFMIRSDITSSGYDNIAVGLGDQWMIFLPGWNVWITVHRIMVYDREITHVLEALNDEYSK